MKQATEDVKSQIQKLQKLTDEKIELAKDKLKKS
jgi:hypothetical protein